MQTIYTPYNFTVSDISSGPPASPSTGDIWIATNVDSNGTRWQFQYNAGSASTYKWEFIGGPDLVAAPASPGTTSATWAEDAANQCRLTIPRSGDYVVRWGASRGANGTSNQGGYVNVADVSVGPSSVISPTLTPALSGNGVNYQNSCFGEIRATGLTGGHALGIVYQTLGSGNLNMWGVHLAILPVRIS